MGQNVDISLIVKDMRKLAAEFGTSFLQDFVTKVDLDKRPFEIFTNDTKFKGR